ncbi:hypothetical protein GWK16_22530 [Roseomonas sp. JC162]|uniref:HMA domain-containing protein n=1 Tax=Neoroseomonas marina TaxID=1232220 RepID=A0A848EJD2_9PROT|nr:hypothetical protein [Neoroseomonas marina]NMJ44042.1 hypothetical protein [Neoroseomonas marina]
MTGDPPPDAVVLSVQGVRGALDRMRVEQALRRDDPAARLWTNWPQGMVAVQSVVPGEALRRAVQDAGFIAALLHGVPTAPERGIGEMILRVIGFTFAGFVLGGLVGAALGIAALMLDPSCNAPGDSGGCAMGIPMIAIGTSLLGAPIGFALAFLRRRRR